MSMGTTMIGTTMPGRWRRVLQRGGGISFNVFYNELRPHEVD